MAQLAKANKMQLIDQFGSWGNEMIMSANGMDESEVTENYEVKSIGRELTFEKNTDDDTEILNAIGKLGTEVMKEVAKSQISFKTITLKLRYGDFTEHIHSRSVKLASNLETIIGISKELYKERVDRSRKVRKIGVRVSNFVSSKGQKKII